jgi:hypothetical protein
MWEAITARDSLVSATRRNAGDRGDVRRMAHNPEVEGSNPSPLPRCRSEALS